MRSLPLYTSWLLSLLWNVHILDNEHRQEIISPTFAMDNFSELFFTFIYFFKIQRFKICIDGVSLDFRHWLKSIIFVSFKIIGDFQLYIFQSHSTQKLNPLVHTCSILLALFSSQTFQIYLDSLPSRKCESNNSMVPLQNHKNLYFYILSFEFGFCSKQMTIIQTIKVFIIIWGYSF